MGGRGAASGVSDKGLEYGTEFKTLIRVDNTNSSHLQRQGRLHLLLRRCRQIEIGCMRM
jgi:hypothetical protein